MEKFDDINIEIEEIPQYADKNISITVAKEILDNIMDYSKKDLYHERGGVLLGNLEDSESKYEVVITDILIANYTINNPASLTFTHETWIDIDKQMENYEGKIMVGWFHSHPGYGVFLSEMDMFIQNNFFNLPYQIAYVVDPCNNTEGFFAWEFKGKIQKANDIRTIVL